MLQFEAPILDQEKQKKARRYSGIRRRLTLFETGLSLAVLLVLIFSRASSRLAGVVQLAGAGRRRHCISWFLSSVLRFSPRP